MNKNFIKVFILKVIGRLTFKSNQIYIINKTIKNKKNILEIGGPTKLYKSSQLYIQKIKFANYKKENHWNSYCDYVYDPVNDVNNINEYFDFIIASHVLEHTSNPIKYLKKLKNILTKNGEIFISVPNKNYCFDIARNYTSYQHIYNDYREDKNESDLTHRDEFLKIINKKLVSNYEELVKDQENKGRMIHHHVFNKKVLVEIIEFSGYKVSMCSTDLKGNIYILAKNV